MFNLNIIKTKEIKENHPEKITAWKVLRCLDNKFASLYFDMIWNIGENLSNRKSSDISFEEYCLIKEGIHTFTRNEDAINYIPNLGYKSWYFNNGWGVVAVTCSKEDFIGCNHDDTERVYNKVTLLEESLQNLKIEFPKL